jgi:hypothetical protein
MRIIVQGSLIKQPQISLVRGGAIAVFISRREMSSVPISWVIILTAGEWINLQMWVQVITSRKVLHLSNGVIIHPVGPVVVLGHPTIHLTHPSPFVGLPISLIHMPKSICRTTDSIPMLLLLLLTLIILIIIIITILATALLGAHQSYPLGTKLIRMFMAFNDLILTILAGDSSLKFPWISSQSMP